MSPIDEPPTVCFNREKVEGHQAALPLWCDFDTAAAAVKAVAHPGRIATLFLIAREECCVCDVSNVLGIPVSTASQHLQRLKQAGLLTSRTEGKWVIYSIADRAGAERALALAFGGGEQ